MISHYDTILLMFHLVYRQISQHLRFNEIIQLVG